MQLTTSIQRASKALSLALTLILLGACATTGEKKDEPAPPPEIVANMPLNQALEAGINFGGETLEKVKKLVRRRHEGEKAGLLLRAALQEHVMKYEHHQLFNAAHLFMFSPQPLDASLFRLMTSSGRPLANQLAWQLAAVKASPQVAAMVDAELTRAVRENDEEVVMLPQMANAVAANKLKSSYTLVRQGLMSKGNEEFAKAMITLAPARAATDFLPFLAQATPDELRQLTLSSVNLYTAMIALEHVRKAQPSVGSPQFEHLFYYAVSRNNALADLAQSVLESYIPIHAETLAQMLAKHPAWVQIAYLENVRQHMNPKVGILLGELKKSSSEIDVVEEINEIKF